MVVTKARLLSTFAAAVHKSEDSHILTSHKTHKQCAAVDILISKRLQAWSF